MLPMRWDQPPCRNIEVNKVAIPAVTGSSPVTNAAVSRCGTSPHVIVNWRRSGPSRISYKNATQFTATTSRVTTGTVLEGFSSRSGIMSGSDGWPGRGCRPGRAASG